MRSHRPSPSLVVAGIALLFALGGSAFAIGQKTAPQPRCQAGAVRAIAVVTGVPGRGIENLPGDFTSNAQAFGRRFNDAAVRLMRNEDVQIGGRQ